MISLPAELAEQVEDYRFSNRLKTEAEALRRLIQLGLEAAASPPKKGRAGAAGRSAPS